MPILSTNPKAPTIRPNRIERQQDELQLAVMAELEAQGVQVIVEGEGSTLRDMLNDQFQQEAAERAWHRSRWDGLL